MKQNFRTRLGGSSALVCLALAIHPAAAEDVAPVLDEVIVTAPMMDEPMVIVTDPHNPRSPIPPADGAGYLKNIPGFSVVRQSAVDGDPLLRGQGGSRLNILLDDAPVLGGCPNRMDPASAYIFPDSFDKLTVLKGPQSVVHGGSALGTVLVERTPPRFKELSFNASTTGLYGSRDRNEETIDVSAGDKPGFLRAIATHSSSDDYEDGNGNAIHSRYWRQSGTGMVGWTPDDNTLLQFSFDKSRAQAAYVGAMDGSQFDREGLNLLFSRSNLSPLFSQVKAQVYHNYVDHIMDVYTLRRSINNMNMGASQVDHLMQGGKLSTELTPNPATKVTLGVDYNSDIHSKRSQTYTEYVSGVGLGTKSRVRDLSFDTYSGFTEAKHDLSATNRLAGGYRYSWIKAVKSDVYPNFEDRRSVHSAFGRYEHDLDLGMPVTGFASLGYVERAPDFWERNKETGNEDTFRLNSERTRQLDVGSLFRQGPWRGAASLFFAHTDDYILVGSAAAKNVEARRFGGEAELSYRLLPVWTLEATAAYVKGDNLTDKAALAQTPPLDTSLAVKYDDGSFLGGLHLRAVAGQSRVDPGWGNIISQDLTTGGGRTGGFAVWSANAGWRATEAVTLTAGIDNIFDKAYAEHVSKTGTNSAADLSAYADNVRVNEPGRTLWMRGSAKF